MPDEEVWEAISSKDTGKDITNEGKMEQLER
jgi:hypothetical protein